MSHQLHHLMTFWPIWLLISTICHMELSLRYKARDDGFNRAVVVAQLVEWSRPTPEVNGSNPAIGKRYIECLLSTVLKRQKY